MARTKGARDAKPRKKAAAKPRKASPAAAKTMELGPTSKLVPPAEIQRPPVPPDDFQAAIAAELNKASLSPGPESTLAADAAFTHTDVSAPGPAFDPASLTLDGLASAWGLAYYALGVILAWLRVTPDADAVAAVGRRRGKDLAKPSYVLYEHWTREYLDLNPQNTVHVAGGATILNFVGTVPEIIDAVRLSRKRAAQQPRQPASPAAGNSAISP
jgi:hypothetical protein